MVNRKLNGPLVSGGNVLRFQISPDSQWVVYLADQNTDQVFELYSVPIRGGTPVRLNVALPSGSDASLCGITPDSRRVVFIAPQETTGKKEVFCVPIQGPASAAVKLSRTIASPRYVDAAIVNSSGTRVVYRVRVGTGISELYSVPITGPGSASVRVDRTMVSSSPGTGYGISPNGERVVYWGAYDTAGVAELYSVPILGPAGATVKLNTPLVAGGGVGWFDITSDGSRLVYLADQLTLAVREVFSVPIAGPAADGIKLNTTLALGSSVGNFRISPNNERVIYDVSAADPSYELWSVPIAGPASAGVKIGEPRENWSWVISPNSARVVFKADRDATGGMELYSVPIAGPRDAGVEISKNLGTQGGVEEFRISPDSRYVVYRADPLFALLYDNVFRIFSVPIAGPASANVTLDKIAHQTRDVSAFRISPHSQWVAYVADQTTDEVRELYLALIRGPASAGIKLSGPMVTGGDMAYPEVFEFSPDSACLVYLADQTTNGVDELYVSYDRPTAAGNWRAYK